MAKRNSLFFLLAFALCSCVIDFPNDEEVARLKAENDSLKELRVEDSITISDQMELIQRQAKDIELELIKDGLL